MKLIGKTINTFSAKNGESGLPRPKVDSLNLIVGYGIEFDKFAGLDEEKSVMIVGNYTYNLAKENNIELKEGSLGENILFDFNPHDYSTGTIFQIANTILQVTQNCTICNHLTVFDDDLPILVQDCRGLYCKILKGGEIKKDSPIYLIEKWQQNVAS